MLKVTIEKPSGERIEFEGDKVRVAWHNDTYAQPEQDDPDWHYEEFEDEAQS